MAGYLLALPTLVGGLLGVAMALLLAQVPSSGGLALPYGEGLAVAIGVISVGIALANWLLGTHIAQRAAHLWQPGA